MKNKTLFIGMVLVLAGLAAIQYSANRQMPESGNGNDDSGVAIAAPGDPEMQNAFNKARRSLDYFLGVAESPPPDTRGFSVKVGVVENELTEFFWVYPFAQEEEGFSGRINSTPQIVNNVLEGEVINFERGQIVDWTFEDTATEIMHGNYTGCVLLEREAPENAAQFQKLYGLECNK
ncbi:MAG: DUF2314 domain-containing protein [Cellvibrionaceae bacterium]